MDKVMLHAVAGSGKTSHIISELSLDENTAIITYTRANQSELRKKIIKRFKHMPNNIHIFGLFEFLYSFCYLPIQQKYSNKGICFDQPHFRFTGYHTKDGRIYSNKLSKFLLDNKVPYLQRIDKYFDKLFIDEVQDLGSYDFDWVLTLGKLEIPTVLVGDFYQSTFVTSRHGNKGQGLHKNYESYKGYFSSHGFHFDEVSLTASHRCSKNVCEYIQENLGIQIASHRNDETIISKVESPREIEIILENDSITKLFYKKHDSYVCESDNWGSSKGLTLDDVCVILNPSTVKLFKGELHSLAPMTLAKFYVACSRTKGNLYFIEQKHIPAKYNKM